MEIATHQPRLYCTFGPLGHGPPNNWRDFTRARTRIGHVANFARAILDNGGKLTRVHTWLSTMSQFHMRVIWANSHMRIRDYWPCREFARAWFGLTRACTYATIDNVVNSHALDLSKLVRAYATLVKLQTRVYANAAIDHVGNSHARDLG